MTIAFGWSEIILRLALAVLAGTLLGLDRTERGMVAGLRTTLLVCVAAAVSMIQVNLLLDLRGKTPDSFAVMDLMRLPLGILTGVGFIGAGAILHRGDMVRGVTTAATLWLATVLGLCFGGGQHGLGLAGLGLGTAILWALKWLEAQIKRECRAILQLTLNAGGPNEDDIRARLQEAGYRVASWDVAYRRRDGSPRTVIRSEVHWRGRPDNPRTPEVVHRLAQHEGVESLRWKE